MTKELINASSIQLWDTAPTEYVTTDSPTLNEALGGGMRTSNLIVLQAPTGEGKTTFLMRLAIRSIMSKKRVLYVSVGEQTPEEIYMRLKCMIAGVTYNGNSREDYSEEDADRIEETASSGFFDNLYVQYTDDSISKESLERAVHEFNIKYIFIDYIGSSLAERADQQYSYLTKLSSELKNYADENHICIITAMQTNRALLAELKSDNLDVTTIDETFMADSVGPARKATVCLSLFTYRGQKYITLFKNRLKGSKVAIPIQIKPQTYQWVELFNRKEGF